MISYDKKKIKSNGNKNNTYYKYLYISRTFNKSFLNLYLYLFINICNNISLELLNHVCLSKISC